MDWEFLMGAPMPPQSQLLHGCFLEAERADRVARGLEELRKTLKESYHGHMIAVIEEIRRSARILRDLADRGHVHVSRAPIVANHLNVVLPCMSKTLRDITGYYDDKTITRETRWRKMYHEMLKEGGLPLPQRFMLYNHFLTLLLFLLTRDKNYDQAQLEIIRVRIMELRQRRGIPAPIQAPVMDLVRQETMVAPLMRERPHWAQLVLDLPLVSRTDMNGSERSQAIGPFAPAGGINIPDAAKVLLKRSFDNDRLCLIIALSAVDGAPYIVLRVYDAGAEWLCYRGVHEICVYRDENSLKLKRWSITRQASKVWAVLSFITWEELVIFHCAFTALKARNPFTISMGPWEYKIRGEKRLFQANIIDDGYHHILIIYEDSRTKGLRLHAAVRDGELKQCPVWTGFAPRQPVPDDWLVRKSKHRVWIKSILLYVFCDKYREAHMRRKGGMFEIEFVSDEAAGRFKEVFCPTPVSEPTEGDDECIAGPSSYT
ncbi:hypothetical protein VMCG_01519 [Cytospora schulzeri]|uniref:Uncharacterized protein n=1 Tax=Cytospora schulzeri TaxID=448051 RepID=A0A423X5T1_9PEZI|nr:hypothetical protein VMCG_01519 [Valsa malicola]